MTEQPAPPKPSQNRPGRLLTLRTAGILAPTLLVVALLQQAAHEYLAPFPNIDQLHQIAASHSFLLGHGFSIPTVDRDDLSKHSYTPLLSRPPGYSLAFAPFLRLTRDERTSAFILNCLSGFLFFISWYLITLQLKFLIGSKAFLFLWFYWAFAYPPLLILGAPGKLAVALFSAAIAVSLISLARLSAEVLAGVISGGLLGLACVTRFAYWPLILVVPFSLASLAWLYKSTRLLTTAFFHTLCAGAMMAATGIFHLLTGGRVAEFPTYQFQSQGLWENVAQTPPFPSYALGLEYAWKALAERFHWAERLTVLSLWSVSALVLACLAVWVAHTLREELRSSGRSMRPGLFFFLSGGLTVVLTYATLAYSSIRYSDVIGEGFSFFAVARLYGPVYGFLVVGIAGVAFGRVLIRSERIEVGLRLATRTLVIFALLAMVPWRLTVLAEDFKRAPEVAGGYFGREVTAIWRVVREARDSGLPIVFVDDYHSYESGWRRAAAAMSGASNLSGRPPREAALAATGRVMVVVAVPSAPCNECDLLREIVARHRGRRVATTESSTVYQLILEPGQDGRSADARDGDVFHRSIPVCASAS